MSLDDKTINVVVIAYACEPNRGSEPGTGWNIVNRLAESCNVTVITRANNEPVITKDLVGKSNPNLQFKYVDPSSFILKLKKLKIVPVQLFYWFWQRAVAKILRDNSEFEKIDIIHQMTFNSFEIPPLIFATKSKIHYIWGPIGGGQYVESNLLPLFGIKGGFKEAVRNVRVKASSLNPLCVKALKNASLVYFANHETRHLLEKHCKSRVEMMIDVGVDVKKFNVSKKGERENDKHVVLFAGRLEGRKGAILLFKAIKQIIDQGIEIECRVVGNGPSSESLRKYIKDNGLEKNIIMLGLVSHAEMVAEFEKAEMFAFPSLRDTSGTVVLEAMSMEIPTICFNHQGGALMVDDDCGIKIKNLNITQMVDDLSKSLIYLSDNPEIRLAMGKASRVKVENEYDWDVRVDRLLKDYKEVLDR